MADRIVIVGGAMMGASLAWWLTEMGHPPGRITVVERDPSYAASGTAFSNSCIRQQFGNALNVRISRFGLDYLRDFPARMGDARVPPIAFRPFGYLYLAANAAQADRLRAAREVQASAGAATELLAPDEIARRWPFLEVSDLVLGSFGPEEGYFDGTTMFDWWRRMSGDRGVDWRHDEVTGIDTKGGRVRGVTCASGQRIEADTVVIAAGTRSAQVAAMAGLDLPVEPRKRYTWVFDAARPGTRDLPLTIDPTGFHVRTAGAGFMAGATPATDPGVDPDDFDGDWEIWEEVVWPVIAARIPAFETLRVRRSWLGHYDLTLLDANAVIGPWPDLPGLVTMCGFSGHGLQQAPAIGRGLAELLTRGRFETLDLSPLGPARLLSGEPFPELAII